MPWSRSAGVTWGVVSEDQAGRTAWSAASILPWQRGRGSTNWRLKRAVEKGIDI
jgi:hypothetical protein